MIPIPAFQLCSGPDIHIRLGFQFCSASDIRIHLTLYERLPLHLPYPHGKVLLSALTAPIHFTDALEPSITPMAKFY